MQDLLTNIEQHLLELIFAPIITGLVTSLLFLLLLSLVRPRLAISPRIAKLRNGEFEKTYRQKIWGQNGYIYLVKVRNKSRLAAIEVEARLTLSAEIMAPGGRTSVTRDVPLDKSALFELPGYRRNEQERSVFRFVSPHDVENSVDGWSIANNNKLVFTIRAKHSPTGFGRVFRREYNTPVDGMQEGMFRSGASMDIVAVPPVP